jgi:hypothetical protein
MNTFEYASLAIPKLIALLAGVEENSDFILYNDGAGVVANNYS